MRQPTSGATLRELEEIIATFPHEAISKLDPRNGQLSVRQMLGALGCGTPEAPARDDAYILDQLCRKLAIAKRVWAEYTDDWRKPADATPLPPEDWALLLAVLARYGAPDADRDGALRPMRLKWMNGALVARDLAPAEAMDARFRRVSVILDRFVDTVRAQCGLSP